MTEQTPVVEEVVKQDKWIRTRKCGCGTCRDYSMQERPVCPMEKASNAIWLWRINPSMMGLKDYQEPSEFLQYASVEESESPSQEGNVEEDGSGMASQPA